MTIFDWFSLALRSLLAYVFIAYGTEKLFHFRSFAATIRGYHIVPNGASPILARTLPPLEIGLGTLLLFNIAPIAVAAALALLLLVFSMVLLTQGSGKKDCGCTTSSPTIISVALKRNGFLLVCLAVVNALETNSKPQELLPFEFLQVGIIAYLVARNFANNSHNMQVWLHKLQHIRLGTKPDCGFAREFKESPALNEVTTNQAKRAITYTSRRAFVSSLAVVGASLTLLMIGGQQALASTICDCNCIASTALDYDCSPCTSTCQQCHAPGFSGCGVPVMKQTLYVCCNIDDICQLRVSDTGIVYRCC